MSVDQDLELAREVGRFYDDPLGFVMFAYPWDTDPSLQLVELVEPWASRFGCKYGPDRWACEFLDDLGRQVRERAFDGKTAVAPIREAIASGHGIGKSALVGWLVDWIMSTRPLAQGTVTATTAPQLRTKTWAQIVKWTKKCITGHWFDITTSIGLMSMRHKRFPEEWFCTAQTCAEENSEAFAGQHAANSTSFYVFDEASGVPNKIDEVSEGGLTDGEPMKFAFGNPTQNEGWFYDAFHKLKHRWGRRQIDSRSVAITNKALIEEWIADHGADSDFVKVRVRGMFPAMSAKQFISVTDADAGMTRHLRPEQYSFAPKVLTLDNAWEGDDPWVVGLRQGLRFEVLRSGAKNDNDVEMANLLARLEDEHGADAVFVDAGYGTGVASVGKTMGRDWQLVWAAGQSPEPGYLNMRAWTAKEAREWLKKGGAYGADNELHDEILSVHTVPRADGVVQLEAKKDMKRRDVASPNRFDALALSFAYPARKKTEIERLREAIAKARTEGAVPGRGHDPYAVVRQGRGGGHDPYARNSR